MPRLSRFLLIALMLVLLTFRGWAGDVMAVSMAATAVVQAKMGGMTNQASMPADCAMHAQLSTDDVAEHCSNCDTCELCLAVANLTFATWVDTQQPLHCAPMDCNASFSNAVRAIQLKPPISRPSSPSYVCCYTANIICRGDCCIT